MSENLRRTIVATFLLALVQPGAATAQQGRAELESAIAAVIDAPAMRRAHWGIAVQDLATGTVLYEHDAAKLFIPASNQKLIVTAAAAHHLPRDYRHRTEIASMGAVQIGVLDGDLILRGSGDPTISGRYEPTMTTVFERWADSLSARGFTRIDGGIIVDQTRFDASMRHGDWSAYDLNWWYAAPVAPFGFNDNSVDFRVEAGAAVGAPARITWQPESEFVVLQNNTTTTAAGTDYTLDFDRIPGTDTVFAYGQLPIDADVRTESFAVRDPGYYAAFVLRDVLARKGITVRDPDITVVYSPSTAPEGMTLFEYASPPLEQVIRPILQTSQNWFAEMLLKTLGTEVGDGGSFAAGVEVERRFLVDVVGIDSTAFEIRDASGLSSGNLITPQALTELVRYIARTPQLAAVHGALPVSGAETGSLRRRLTDLSGRVRAKTGSISNVDSLTGIVTTASGRELAFAILANNTGAPGSAVRAAIDDVVRILARQ